MTVEVIERPVVDDTGTKEPSVSHIISRDDEMRGYFNGEEIVALCGERFIPTRDPNRYPLCEPCKTALRAMFDS